MQVTSPIRTYRESHQPKLSQEALAKKIGVARLTVLRWETGERKIDADKIARVSQVTGIPAKELRPDLIEKHEKIFGVAQ